MVDEELVRAAGGVVWCQSADHIEVVVVHRPKYDDWSLPKGKLEEGESFATAAAREIVEETGAHGELGADLGEIRYTDHKDRPKVVRWWAMRAEEPGAEGESDDPDEVDEVRWVSLRRAQKLLTYDTDREVLARFEATVPR